jgi:NAD(P) transhydrogenase subunit alpha
MAGLTPEQALQQAEKLAAKAQKAADAAAAHAQQVAESLGGTAGDAAGDVVGAAAHAASGGAIDPFVFQLSIFMLACFVGYYVVWSVTPALHTPLMSVTNAISSVIVVGALLAVGVEAVSAMGGAPADPGAGWARGFGFAALVLASVNIFGGFLVTQRMLAMYKKKTK